jgi:hypothetical protein
MPTRANSAMPFCVRPKAGPASLRRHGPEQAEGAEQAGVIQRAPTQHHRRGQQRPQRADQAPVRLCRRWLAQRQLQLQHHGQQGDQRGGDPEHGVPATEARQHAGDRARHHDPQQQATDHLADDLAARGFRRQVRGERHQHLGHYGAQADGQRGQQECPRRGGGGRDQQGSARDKKTGDDQAPVFHQVAQRHDEQEAQCVANLGQRDNQPGRCRRQAQRGADRADERLRIIKVGDDDAGRSGQQHDHAGRDGR